MLLCKSHAGLHVQYHFSHTIVIEDIGAYCLYCKEGTGLLSGSSVFVSALFTATCPDKLVQHEHSDSHQAAAAYGEKHESLQSCSLGGFLYTNRMLYFTLVRVHCARLINSYTDGAMDRRLLPSHLQKHVVASMQYIMPSLWYEEQSNVSYYPKYIYQQFNKVDVCTYNHL